jgi:hypothetical protein
MLKLEYKAKFSQLSCNFIYQTSVNVFDLSAYNDPEVFLKSSICVLDSQSSKLDCLNFSLEEPGLVKHANIWPTDDSEQTNYISSTIYSSRYAVIKYPD